MAALLQRAVYRAATGSSDYLVDQILAIPAIFAAGQYLVSILY